MLLTVLREGVMPVFGIQVRAQPLPKEADYSIRAVPIGAKAEPYLTDAVPRGRSRQAVRG